MTDFAGARLPTPEPDEANDLCRSFLCSLPISGVSVTVISSSGIQSSLCSSDPVSARIDELQFELGEGPQWSTARSGDIMLLPDVRSGGHNDWPVFGAALRELPVAALFSVPMRMGAVTVGVATLHHNKPGQLKQEHQDTSLAIASAIASAAVQRAMASATDDAALESAATPALRREVHQATGMTLVHLDTTATIAYSRLQAYAFSNGRTVQAVAREVVAGTLRLEKTFP
jgi:GAF domain-containing protein